MLATSLVIGSLLAGSALAAPPLIKRETHTVKVGFNNTLKFEPYAIFANPGDIVNFVFQSKNHSVVQSSLHAPCSPLAGGFNSGFQLVANGTAEDKLPVVSYTVVTPKETPVWLYCSQAAHTANSHCAKEMLFSINCGADGADNSFEKFAELAKSDPAATAPVEDAPIATDVIVPLTPEPQYEGVTIPPAVPVETKTDVITLGTQTWTTTYASYEGSPDPTPSSADGSVITVNVGKDGALTFDPINVVVKPRDILEFVFHSKNHSVVQSSFAAPCSPLRTAQGAWGINSGFFPVTDGQQPLPTFRVKINDTTPFYAYCSQAAGTANSHCGKGMVFSTNLVDSSARSPAAFQQLAKQINGTTDGAPSGGNTTDGGNGGNGGPGAAVALGFNSGFTLAALVAGVAMLAL